MLGGWVGSQPRLVSYLFAPICSQYTPAQPLRYVDAGLAVTACGSSIPLFTCRKHILYTCPINTLLFKNAYPASAR